MDWSKVGDVLGVFLVLAVVFEVALTPLYTWRVFLARFDGKGLKFPITTILAFAFVSTFQLDLLEDLLKAMGKGPATSKHLVGYVIGALLIAGGSDGVLTIFSKLGIRNPAAVKEKAEEARKALAAQQAPEKK